VKKPGPHAARPILTGVRGLVCSDFLGFGGGARAMTDLKASGGTEATGVSPWAGSCPTSRRGQTKSSARPGGGASGSPFTSVRAANASTAAGREPGRRATDRCRPRMPPAAGSVPPADAVPAGPAARWRRASPVRSAAQSARSAMAAATGFSHTTIRRIWTAFGLQPHRSQTFKLSSDPLFVDKVRDIIGLYLKSAITLSTGTSRPSSHMTSRFRPASQRQAVMSGQG
jgi:hypothetical protein